MRTLILGVLCVLICQSVLFAQTDIDNSLQSKVEEVKKDFTNLSPEIDDPLDLKACVVYSESKEQCAILIQAKLLEQWHIYAFVGADSPFIITEIKVPEVNGLNPIGEWEKPGVKQYPDNVFVYEGNLAFVHYFKVDKELLKEQEIEVGLYYQTCDPYQCLPPRDKLVKVQL